MNLIELFDREKVVIDYIQTGTKNANLTIRLKDKRHFECWTYFCKRLMEKEIAVYTKNYPRITININDGKYDDFLDMLAKGYYRVNPKQKNISILVKPTVQCNLDCQYCYDKPFRESIKTSMSIETVEDLVRKVAEYAEECVWIWHGGEPTLMGVEWFNEVYEKVFSKYPMVDFDFSIMSNGINFNDAFLELFQKYNIAPGSSYNMDLQDELRCSNNGKEYSSQIWENYLAYKVKGQYLGVIEVINERNVSKQIEIYEKYKKEGIGVSFNNIFHTDQSEKNKIEVDFNVYSKHFNDYLKHYIYDTKGIYERSAIEAIRLVIGSRKLCCTNSDCRYEWFGILPNGDIYPCDRYFKRKYCVGNIIEFNSIEELFKSEKYRDYASECQTRFDTHCKDCGYFELCVGGCNASAIESSGSAAGVEQFYCELFKAKFKIAYELLRNIDVVRDKLNPYVKNELLENEFYSMVEIKQYLRNKNKNLEMHYDKMNLLDCLEYKVFRGINEIKLNNKPKNHIDFYNSKNRVAVRKNKQKRRKKLELIIKGHFNRLEVKYGHR